MFFATEPSVSIHTRVKRVTVRVLRDELTFDVSIHTRVKRVTGSARACSADPGVSIHTRVKRVTDTLPSVIAYEQFQSTPA